MHPVFLGHGDATLLHRPTIGLVGARNASSLEPVCRAFWPPHWGKGVCDLLGLARGVDTAVHAASIGTGTIAVLGGGVDVIYPAENAQLTRQIRENGLLF